MGTADGHGSVLNVLGDPKTRRILAILSVEQHSVKELAETTDMSEPTIYRRISNLEDQNLIEKKAMISPNGVHYRTHEGRFSSAMIRLEEAQFQVSVVHDSSYGGSLATLWNEIRRTTD